MNSTPKLGITELISEGLCIGCGNCAAYEPKRFSIVETAHGLLQAEEHQGNPSSDSADICPFLNDTHNEDYFNNHYKSDSNHFDPEIGFFKNVFAGYANNEKRRHESSSGGLTTYLLEQLFKRNLITGAIVVHPAPGKNGRLEYRIARNQLDLEGSRKSKYHMVSHDSVISEILASHEDERFIYVGIPCGVKAIKLLCKRIPHLNDRIIYTAAIFCGHQKSHAFTEFVGWQMGVHPTKLDALDYRVKKPTNDASRYFYRAISSDGAHEQRVDRLKWMDWGLGLFKPKACDFCDDVTGEAADIIFGDAWHRKYARDYRGTNLVITRSAELERILIDGSDSGEITLSSEGKSLIYATQGGNFRHRHEGLLSRIRLYESKNLVTPPKSIMRLSRYVSKTNRDRIYTTRHYISKKSHDAFLLAKESDNLNVFYNEMRVSISEYYRETRTLRSAIRAAIRRLLRVF
ncbi:predicted Coenzyme F420-reducing hydrogenase, beta subunit [Aromatoleum aromaticum EbN1]|uniref:Predicted Coenzyme F420-reducing hydrogenase, beta subunit n=1 Tax=Aromatoleum aromaticum (strain DSM 19018 / LMG 30748 / EbN1) TaxID=76114 RepID=Q5P6V8_AROAE|nr:Coenzyme F420 hydrogenase/dehydrogenase, beta subunit C-terminal domain [Aromatoleum aromaticum]CAI06953.1 predicted Coenzyme F420-reducing hydrogenase, beta subunit [Aromatoleum aromaticum EbN1]